MVSDHVRDDIGRGRGDIPLRRGQVGVAEYPLDIRDRDQRVARQPVGRGMPQVVQGKAPVQARCGPLEHRPRGMIGQRAQRPAQRPPHRLIPGRRHQAVELLLIKAKPDERVRRGRKLLHGPGPLAHHGDQLLARIYPGTHSSQQFRGPGPCRDPERDQGTVPVRAQRSEQTAGHLVRDLARYPLRHPRPVAPGTLRPERAKRIAVRTSPRPAHQRERIDDRAAAALDMERVERPCHRLSMRDCRCRQRLARGGGGQRGPGSPAPPVRSFPPATRPQPGDEIPGLISPSPVPRNLHGPQEPEPPEKIHAVRALSSPRAARRAQLHHELIDRSHGRTSRIDQLERLENVIGPGKPAGQRHPQRRQVAGRVCIQQHDRRK